MRELVDEIMLVDTDEICAAIKDVFEDTRAILEPAGALAIAGAKALRRSERACATEAGRDRLRCEHELRSVALRRRARRGRRASRGDARGHDPERPGSFKTFCALLGRATSPNSTTASPMPKHAHVFVGVRGAEPRREARLMRSLRRAGLQDRRSRPTTKWLSCMSGTWWAVTRARATTSWVYRFEFPERPGALMKFLTSMRSRLEHQPVSLSQSRLGHRARAGGHAGAGPRGAGVRAVSCALGYPYVDETAQSGLSPVPRLSGARRAKVRRDRDPGRRARRCSFE